MEAKPEEPQVDNVSNWVTEIIEEAVEEIKVEGKSPEGQGSPVKSQKSSDETNTSSQEEAKSPKKEINIEAIPPQLSGLDALELFEKCMEFYKNHKIGEAVKVLRQIEAIKQGLNEEMQSQIEEVLKKEEKMIEEIESEFEYLEQILEALYGEGDWKHEDLGPKSKLSYKKESNDLVTIKMEAEIDVPVLHLLSMINEVELWKLWNPLMNKTAEVASIHRASRVYYVEYGLPYPLANREIHLYGVGVNRLYENGTILIMAKSVDEDKKFFEKHNIIKYQHKGAVNIDVHLGGFEITPLGRHKCLLRGVTNINPKFDWIPKNILNWVLKKGTKQMVDKIAEGAKKFKGSAWEKEIKSERKRGFYEWLDIQLDEYHDKNDKNGPEDKK